MEDKIKKLIAIGASVSANCHSCLEHHVREARAMGLDETDIINQLPKNARTVIVLSDLEHFTDREISDILNIKPSAVKVRLHRARALLKKELEANCAFYRTKDNIFACDKKKPVLLSFNKRLDSSSEV